MKTQILPSPTEVSKRPKCPSKSTDVLKWNLRDQDIKVKSQRLILIEIRETKMSKVKSRNRSEITETIRPHKIGNNRLSRFSSFKNIRRHNAMGKYKPYGGLNRKHWIETQNSKLIFYPFSFIWIIYTYGWIISIMRHYWV